MIQLTPAQEEVVDYPDRSLLVVAGAGSGKTRAITHRAARLVHEGAKKDRVLVITFTRYATREFQHRLDSILGKDAKKVWTGTIHAIGRKVLKKYGAVGGFNPKFTVFDEGESRRLVRDTLQALHLRYDKRYVEWMDERIAGYKVQHYTPPALLALGLTAESWETDLEFMDVYRLYEKQLARESGMDLTDLVVKCVDLMRRCPEVLRQIGLEHILVDEFQDTDPTQVALVQLLQHGQCPVTCVGDVDQSVYRFRGAEPGVMLNFQRYFPDAASLYLSENHRSTRSIVQGAVGVIGHNRKRIRHGLFSSREYGVPIQVLQTGSDSQECELVGAEIERLLEDPSFSPRLRLSEIAILARTNWQLDEISGRLTSRKIECRIIRGSFTSSKKSEEQDRVQLLTVHGAKGSEFRVVFLIGVEEDLLPHYNAIHSADTEEAVEEERRLMYVGMTRAKERLILTHSRMRTTANGHLRECQPSRFLNEIPAELAEYRTAPKPHWLRQVVSIFQ